MTMPHEPSSHFPAQHRTNVAGALSAAPAWRGLLPDLKDRRILVVEDEYMLMMDLEEALRAAGASVAGPAACLSDAFDVAGRGPLDGAILDVRLGEEDVFPLADHLRGRDVAFLLVTAVDRGDLPPRYVDAPRCAKPVDMDTAVATLAALIAT